VSAAAGEGSAGQQYDFDLFTIGAGSGGVRGSRIASSYGANSLFKSLVLMKNFATQNSGFTLEFQCSPLTLKVSLECAHVA
jgi:hypothetical protein